MAALPAKGIFCYTHAGFRFTLECVLAIDKAFATIYGKFSHNINFVDLFNSVIVDYIMGVVASFAEESAGAIFA